MATKFCLVAAVAAQIPASPKPCNFPEQFEGEHRSPPSSLLLSPYSPPPCRAPVMGSHDSCLPVCSSAALKCNVPRMPFCALHQLARACIPTKSSLPCSALSILPVHSHAVTAIRAIRVCCTMQPHSPPTPYTHARTRATTCALVQSHQRCLVHFGLRGVLGPFHHLTHMLCFFLIFCICNSSCLHLFFICNHTARASRYNVKYGEHDGILMAIDGRNKRTFESDVISSRTPGRKFYERIILHEQDVMCV